MKCPVCGGEGHYVYNGWCEDCFADGQAQLCLSREWIFQDLVRQHPKGRSRKERVIRKEVEDEFDL